MGRRKLLIVTSAFLWAAAWMQAQNSFIFPPEGDPHAFANVQPDSHASTLVELRNGDILVAYFSGPWEGDSHVKIYGARLHQGSWSEPFELARTKGVACWNPVLFHTQDGKLWLYYKTGTHPSTWTGLRKVSTDEGQTWSSAEALPEGILGPVKDKPFILSNGTIISGSSVEHGSWDVWIERSSDGGKSWTKAGPITLNETEDQPDAEFLAANQRAPDGPDAAVKTKLYVPASKTVGIIQPTIVELAPHHLRLFARSKSRAARIAVADSMDDGKNWTQARFLALPNPNSGLDAVRLRDGRIVLIYNHSTNARTPLVLAVSRDGEHFMRFRTLEDGPGQYSYPAIVQAANGDLLMTYSWRRKTIKFVRLPLSDVPAVALPQQN